MQMADPRAPYTQVIGLPRWQVPPPSLTHSSGVHADGGSPCPTPMKKSVQMTPLHPPNQVHREPGESLAKLHIGSEGGAWAMTGEPSSPLDRAGAGTWDSDQRTGPALTGSPCSRVQLPDPTRAHATERRPELQSRDAKGEAAACIPPGDQSASSASVCECGCLCITCVHRACPVFVWACVCSGPPVGAEPCPTTGFGFGEDQGVAPSDIGQPPACQRRYTPVCECTPLRGPRSLWISYS